jgi:hypothetical protein
VTRKKSNARGATAVILVGVFVVTGLAAYVANGPAKYVPKDELRPEATHETKDQTKPHVSISTQDKGKPQDVTLLTPKFTNGDLTFEKSKGVAGEGKDAILKVVNEYLAKIPAVPKEGRLTDVEQHGGIATLKFTPEFENGYGSEDEEMIIVGILTSLAQFPEIKKAQFTIEGKQLESLGHMDLTTPQHVIRK